MQVTFTTTLEDYVVLNRYAFQKSKAARTAFLLGFLLPLAIMAVAAVVLMTIKTCGRSG